MTTKTVKRTKALVDAVIEPGQTVNVNTSPVKSKSYIANPEHGDKGDFVKISITLPPDIYEELRSETTRRKVAKMSDPTISGVVREALVSYLANSK